MYENVSRHPEGGSLGVTARGAQFTACASSPVGHPARPDCCSSAHLPFSRAAFRRFHQNLSFEIPQCRCPTPGYRFPCKRCYVGCIVLSASESSVFQCLRCHQCLRTLLSPVSLSEMELVLVTPDCPSPRLTLSLCVASAFLRLRVLGALPASSRSTREALVFTLCGSGTERGQTPSSTE